MSKPMEDPSGRRTAKFLVLSIALMFIAGSVNDLSTWWADGLFASSIMGSVISAIAAVVVFPTPDDD